MKVYLENTLSAASTSLYFSQPVRILRTHHSAEVEELLKEADAAVRAGFWVAGYLGYEAGYAFEPHRFVAQNYPFPIVEFGIYTVPDALPSAVAKPLAIPAPKIEFTPSFEAYQTQLHQIKQLIFEGEVYQINYTTPLIGKYDGDALGLFQSLKNRQKTAYSAFIETENRHILSFSPELFFQRKGQEIFAAPMKGTIHRGNSLEEDYRLAKVLENDPKNRAENLMIVDLLRNDLSMICAAGSVKVTNLFETERYETLIQMTSTVQGSLLPSVTYPDIFRALFPCGSITGAPKIRAMQAIQSLENAPRDVYCGSIGYIAPHQEAVFNVAIRTLVLQDKVFKMGVGSGIVWDSEADAEYAECQLKAHFLTSE